METYGVKGKNDSAPDHRSICNERSEGKHCAASVMAKEYGQENEVGTQPSTDARSFARHHGMVTGKHDTCHNVISFLIEFHRQGEGCPFSVNGLITRHNEFVPTIKF